MECILAPEGDSCYKDRFRPRVFDDVPEEAPAAEDIAEKITVADLQSFKPHIPTFNVEPEGNGGILGRPVNVYVTDAEQRTTGKLLGNEVEILWVPVELTIDFGDGTVITRDHMGYPSWDGTGETSTSHAYQETGWKAIYTTVKYEAIVSVEGRNIRVPGTLDVQLPTYDLRIWKYTVRLVRGNCNDYPEDPGCPLWYQEQERLNPDPGPSRPGAPRTEDLGTDKP